MKSISIEEESLNDVQDRSHLYAGRSLRKDAIVQSERQRNQKRPVRRELSATHNYSLYHYRIRRDFYRSVSIIGIRDVYLNLADNSQSFIALKIQYLRNVAF